jgi:hypothetical protein
VLQKKTLLFPLSLFLLVVALTAWHPVVDHDFGFNVAAGKEILSTGKIPGADHLSVAGEGRPWINRLWGFQVLLFFFYNNLGFTGVSLLTSLLACLTFSLLFFSTRETKSFYSFIIFLLALFIVQSRLRERPEIISFFFLACVYYLLESFRENDPPHPKTIFLVPAVQLLWVNTHGLFILGILLQTLLYLSWQLERPLYGLAYFQKTHPTAKKKWILLFVILLSVLASFVNPFGFKGLMVPFEQYRMMGSESFFSNITELMPTYRLLPGLWREEKLYLTFLSLFLFLAAMPFFRPKTKTSIYHFMVFLAFLFLALKANRNVPLFALTTAPFAGVSFSPQRRRDAEKNILKFKNMILPGWNFAVVSLLLGLILLRLADPFATRLFAYPLGTGLYPPEKFATRPVDFMIENHIPGPVFSTDLRDGNLLLWKGIKPVYDGRLEIFGEDFFRQYHEETIQAGKKFEAAMENFGVNAVLVRHLFDNRYPAIALCIPQRSMDLYENPAWALVYFDASFCLFIRNNISNRALVEKYRIDFTRKGTLERIMDPGGFYWPDNKEKYLKEVGRIVSMLVAFKAFPLAEQIMAAVEKVSRPGPNFKSQLSNNK